MLKPLLEKWQQCTVTMDEVKAADAQGIVLDVPTDLQSQISAWLKKQSRSAVALDWYGPRNKLIRRVINLRGGEQSLKYCIIRPEFHAAYRNQQGRKKEFDIVVALGGADARRHLSKILERLANEKGLETRKAAVIYGPLQEAIDCRLGSIKFFKNPENIAEIMVGAGVGITNGGTTLMEFSMLGVPTLVFPQSVAEENFSRTFIDHGCSFLGDGRDGFVERLEMLLNNERLRQEASLKARQLIDGGGLDRIVAIVKEFFPKDNLAKDTAHESQSYQKI